MDDNALHVAYSPRLLLEWLGADRGAFHTRQPGTMVYVDISGFTAMSERLARLGKEGAEEVSDIINSIFTRLLAVAYENGGSLLKFGGDALLLFFEGPKHPERACHAAAWMRRRLREVRRVKTSNGVATLNMHVGINSGEFDLFVLGHVHRELVIAGPASSTTAAMESGAVAGEILVSDATAAFLPESVLGEARAGGRLLVRTPAPPLVSLDPAKPRVSDPVLFIPPSIRDYLEGPADPEHRLVAVAFLRFDGVDALIEREGPEAATEALDATMSVVQAAIEPHGVTFLDSDPEIGGGKFMVGAGAPFGSERDGEQLLRSLRTIIETPHPLPLRIGVNQGHVFAGLIGPTYRRKYSVMGDAVNLSARLMAKAAPDQIIATPGVVQGSQAVFDVQELEPFMVKGKTAPIVAFSVGPVLRSSRARDSEESTPLIGRDRELGMLLECISSARAGAGGLVEIVAEPGMGKSRLLEEFRRLSDDVLFFQIAAEEYESSTPYYVIRRLLRAVLGIDRAASGREAGDTLRERVAARAKDVLPWLPLIGLVIDAEVDETPETQRLDEAFRVEQLQRAVRRVLEASLPETSAIVLEDVHWIDRASSEILLSFIPDLPHLPWMLCLTHRPSGSSYAEAAAGRAELIELEPLPPEDSAALIRAVAKDLAIAPHELQRLADRAGGNPLFLQELVAGLRAAGHLGALPDTIEAIIGARIDRLPPADRALLRNAAVLGTVVQADLLESVLDRDGGDKSVRGEEVASRFGSRLADFLEADASGAWRFRHALIRDVAYEALPFQRRRALHARIGQALEGRAGQDPGDSTEALSLHFHLARAHEKAWRYSVLAGDRAREKAASVQAAEFYQRALDDAGRQHDVDQAELLRVAEALGDVAERSGDYERAVAAYRTARRIAAAEADRARLFRKEGVLRHRMGRFPEALRWYSRGLKLDVEERGASEHVELVVAYAVIRYYQGRYRECIRWCERAVQEATAMGYTPSLAHAYLLLHLAYTHLGSQERAAYRGLALPLFEQLGDFTRVGYVLNNMGIESYYDGDWDLARELYERGRDALEKAGGLIDAADVSYNIAEILSDQGRLGEAELLSREILEIYRASRYPIGQALATANLGRIAARGGRLEEAREQLEDALERFSALGDERYAVEIRCRLAETAVFARDPEGARMLIADASDRVERLGGVPALSSMMERLRGYSLAQGGDQAGGRTALEDAARIAREASVPFELGLALEGLARVIDDPADDDARDAREEADSIFARLGVIATPEVPLGVSAGA